jgi:hypothetical protein
MTSKKIFFSFIAIFLFLGIGYFLMTNNEGPKGVTPEPVTPTPPSQQSVVQETKKESSPAKELPSKLFLEVPFTPQAPTANWDELHNEACEEASVLMAAAYFKGDTRSMIPAEEAEQEIQKLTKWEQDNLGYYLSIDAKETVDMITSVYGLKAELVTNFSETTFKTALNEGKLVIVPVNGRLLGNPYFKQPGPIYHMFVITGYKNNQFIVNEPGTKRGHDYEYSYETIRNAIGDYDHNTKETDPSKPVVIIVSK